MRSFNLQRYKNKVFHTISRYKLVEKGDRIFAGLSGGKDSGSALSLICEYAKEKKIDCEIVAFYIKLGNFIPNRAIDVISKQAEICQVPLEVYNIVDFGIDYRKIAALERPICSSCGVIKRYLPGEKMQQNYVQGIMGMILLSLS